MPIPADQIDADARKIVQRLVRHKHQAFLVGGCVRDLLLERTPKDFDIATSATPPEVKALFRNCRIIGRRFRLAHIFFGSKIIETATFRANPREVEPVEVLELDEPVVEGLPESLDGDAPAEHGRRRSFDRAGDHVERASADDLLIRRDNVFGNAEEDARRRDFTINGLFYDIEADQVIDYVGGLHDLAARTVRTIGDPDIRFREDPIRILRAIKFAARLDFEIDPVAYQAILTHKVEIQKCPPPRVLEEIYRLLKGGAARRSVEILRDTGVLEILVPEVAALLRERPDSVEVGWLWRILDRIDADRALPPTNAVLLCALLAPFIGEALVDDAADAKVRDIGAHIEERTRGMLERMRVSRRDGERARQILLAQRRIAPSKRRRGRATTLVRRDYFAEALQVYELVGQVIRPDEAAAEELTRWRRMLAEGEAAAPAATGDAAGAPGQPARSGPSVAGDGEPKRKRRRRRGGRRHREGGEESSPEIDVDDELEELIAPAVDPNPRAAVMALAATASSPLQGSLLDGAEPAGDRVEGGAQASAAPPSTGSTTPVR